MALSIVGFVGGLLCITGMFDYMDDSKRVWVSYIRTGYISFIISLISLITLFFIIK